MYAHDIQRLILLEDHPEDEAQALREFHVVLGPRTALDDAETLPALVRAQHSLPVIEIALVDLVGEALDLVPVPMLTPGVEIPGALGLEHLVQATFGNGLMGGVVCHGCDQT